MHTTSLRISREQLDALMHGRRSFFPRQFSGEKIEDKVVQEILELANTAPSHKLTFPWRFVVHSEESMHHLLDVMKEEYLASTEPEKIQQSKVEAFDERKSVASHIIAIIMKRDPAKRIPEWEEISAVSCAVQNIYLSLATYDIGGYWSTGKTLESERLRKQFDLETEDRLMGFFYLGKLKAEFVLPKRETAGNKITWK